MNWRASVIPPLLMLVACATTATVRTSDLDGTWYGSAHQSHTSPYEIHWVIERFPNGTFAMVTYEEKPCGLSVFSREAGRWSMSNDIYTAITTRLNGESVDSSKSYFQDVYEVLSASRNTFKYRSVTYGIEFEARRVTSGYKPNLAMCEGGHAIDGQL